MPSGADSRSKRERKDSLPLLPLLLVSSSNLQYNPVGKISLSPFYRLEHCGGVGGGGESAGIKLLVCGGAET